MRTSRMVQYCLGVAVFTMLAGCFGRGTGGRSVDLPDLTTATWRLAAIDTGGQVTATDDVSPTLHIDADSTVSGSSGCNAYTGRVIGMTSSGIRFSPLATTRRACEDNRMAVERQFLDLMEQVRVFVLTPDTLSLVDSIGANRLLFVAAADINAPQDRGMTVFGFISDLKGDLIFRELGVAGDNRLDDLTGRIRSLYASLAPRPGDSIFVELEVSRLQARTDRTDNRELIVREIYRAQPPEASPQLDLLRNIHFLARGNEPFWAVRITPESIILLEPERDTLVLPIDHSTVTDTSWLYYATQTDGSGDIIRVEILRMDCFDSMSGAYSSLAARLTVGRRELSGCAVRGQLDL